MDKVNSESKENVEISQKEIVDKILKIIRELDENEKKSNPKLPFSSAKSLSSSNEKPLSSYSSLNKSKNSDSKRIRSPGVAGALIGETYKSIISAIIDILDVNSKNHIKKLKHLAKLLYNTNSFKLFNFSYIYKILVWIALRILIDSKKVALLGYCEHRANMNEIIATEGIKSDVAYDSNIKRVINFLTTKKPFYRMIDYDQLLYLFDKYDASTRLQLAKIKNNKTSITNTEEIVINQTKVGYNRTVSITVPILAVLSNIFTGTTFTDKRIYNKIQKAIDKLKAKDHKKINI